MAKISSSSGYTYTLLLVDAQERVLTGFVTARDLAATRRLAASALRLDSRAAFVDVHSYAPHAAELKDREPVVRVSLDDEPEDA